MSEFRKPATVDLEIILNPNKVIMSKTDKEGIFEFANDYFVEVSGYEEYELMGKSIYCTQHPDMPEVIFKLMWEKLLRKENFPILIKNLAKNGKFYWAVSDFDFKVDEDTDELLSIYNRRKSAPRLAIAFFSKLYKKLKDIENESGIALSEKYLMGHLEEIGKTFVELSEQYNKEKSTVKKSDGVISIAPPKPEKTIQSKPIIKEKEPITDNDSSVKRSKFQSEVDLIIQKNKELQDRAKKINSKTTEDKKIEVEEVVKKDIPTVIAKTTAKDKKGFFQKMFGKTEEELEAERKRSK